MRPFFLLPLLLAAGCSLDLRPTVILRLDKDASRAGLRNPSLDAMRFAVAFSGNGMADSYGGSSLRGRSADCLGLGGYVSKLYSFTEIKNGIPLTIPGGIYLTKIVGFYGYTPGAATVPEAMASNVVEIYPIGSSLLNVSQGRGSIGDTYTTGNPENRFSACLDLTGGNTLTRLELFTGFSGVQNGASLAFDPSEGSFPPFHSDGTTMTQIPMAGWNDLFLYNPPHRH